MVNMLLTIWKNLRKKMKMLIRDNSVNTLNNK